MKKAPRKTGPKLYRTFWVNEETDYKIERLISIGKKLNKKYTKDMLLSDACDALWETFHELEEAQENGTLEIEYHH